MLGRRARAERRRSRKSGARLLAKICARFLLLVIVGLLIYGGFRLGRDRVCALFVKLQRVSSETVALTFPASALIIRQESTVKAPASGVMTAFVDEGSKVRVGTKVLEIAAFPGADVLAGRDSIPVMATSSGIVSFRFDGWEGTLTRERLRALGGQVFYQPGGEAVTRSNGDKVHLGDRLFKIVDPAGFQVAALVPRSLAHEAAERGTQARGSWKSLKMRELPEADVACSVAEVILRPGDRDAVVVFDVRVSPESVLDVRKTEVQVVRGVFTGVSVPQRCIVTKDGVKGVYVAEGPVVRFKPVQVKAVEGGMAIVEGIRSGDEVVNNPWLARDGMPLR